MIPCKHQNDTDSFCLLSCGKDQLQHFWSHLFEGFPSWFVFLYHCHSVYNCSIIPVVMPEILHPSQGCVIVLHCWPCEVCQLILIKPTAKVLVDNRKHFEDWYFNVEALRVPTRYRLYFLHELGTSKICLLADGLSGNLSQIALPNM